MTTLAIETLDSMKKVECWFEESKTIIGCRIHLIKVGNLPSGNLSLNVKINGTSIYQQSYSNTELNELDLYWHGFKQFQFTKPLSIKKKPGDIKNVVTFEFSTTCSLTDEIYLGLVREPSPTTDLENTEILTDLPQYDIWKYPFGFELYSYK